MSVDAAALRLRELALAAGADDLAAEAAGVAERVQEQRFHVACVGQFKRGKSTLINALVGRTVLPTGVVPVTSVPTILRHGQPGARVRSASGWTAIMPEDLAQYVTELHNPGNSRAVLGVEVSLPAVVLEEGLCLVDTPGLGSVIEANAAATRAFLPHLDAAVVVLGADPPISGEELNLIEAIAAEVETLVYVVNKVDRVSPAEAAEATGFIREVLSRRLGPVARIYQITALAGGGGPDWGTFVQRLRALAGEQRAALMAGVLRRGVARVSRALAGRLRERLSALRQPLAQYERRVRALERSSQDVGQVLRDLNPLFAAEEQRLTRTFGEWAERFRAEARPAGLEALRAAWDSGRFDRTRRIEELEFANQLARDLIHAWLERTEPLAEAEYAQASQRFSQVTRDHLAGLAQVAGLELDELSSIGADAESFRIRRRFAFTDLMRFHVPVYPWPDILDALGSRAWRRGRRQRRAERYLEELLTVNASRVAGDLNERVRESRREVEAEVRETLRRMSEAAAQALSWARAVRQRGVEQVQRESDRLEALLAEVEAVADSPGDRAA